MFLLFSFHLVLCKLDDFLMKVVSFILFKCCPIPLDFVASNIQVCKCINYKTYI